MWHLLRKDRIINNAMRYLKNYYQRNIAFVRILFLCAAFHSIIFFFACFMHHDDTLHIALTVPPHMRVVCVPSFLASAAIIPATKQTPQRATKKITPEKKQPAKPQKAPKAAKKKTTTIEKATQKNKKKKQEIKKVEPKAVIEKNVAQKQPEKPVEKVVEKRAEQPVQEEVLYVNQETLKTLEIAQQLQKAISIQWCPPPGMQPGLLCEVRVVLNAQGKVTAIEVVKKSGVAVFDMAARTALLATQYPDVVKGRSMVVHFTDAFFEDEA